MAEEVKKVRIYCRCADSGYYEGTCYVPKNGDNGMENILIALGYVADEFGMRAVMSDFDEEDIEFELLQFIDTSYQEANMDSWNALYQRVLKFIGRSEKSLNDWITPTTTFNELVEYLLESVIEIEEKRATKIVM